MLTLKLISEETERVVKGLEKKHFENAKETIAQVLDIDKKRRESQQKLDKNKQEANQLSKKIGGLMKDKKMNEANEIKAQVADLKKEVLFRIYQTTHCAIGICAKNTILSILI